MRWEGGGESGNLEDRRSIGPKTIAAGGIGAVLLLIVGTLIGVNPDVLNEIIGNLPGPQVEQRGDERQPPREHDRTHKFTSTILHFTEEIWTEQFQRAGKRYIPPHMVLFSNRVETGCGVAPSSVGPFYCPADKTVYLDPTFFEELEQKLGGSKAEFSQAYVIAHEVGHHVQNLLGYSRIVDQKRRELSKTEFNKWSVRLELQADYLAGVWAHYGQRKFNFIEPGDIDSAIQTANAIGDDRLQKAATGFVSPEKFTHGRSEQRVRWFRRGLETGNMKMLEKIFEMPYDQL